MELVDKFRDVADRVSIQKPTCIEFDKPYPIMSARIQTYGQTKVVITLALKMSDADDDSELGYYGLPLSYSRVFDDDDFGELNANPGRLKLVFKKKDYSDQCHFLAIVT
jgi:hypothetical protein